MTRPWADPSGPYGRAILWGLAFDGEAGAAWVLRVLRDELAMALAGAPTVADITRDLVRTTMQPSPS